MNLESQQIKRNEYLSPDAKTADLMDLFASKGFQVFLKEKQIQRVEWGSQEIDFAIFDRIDILFRQTAELNDSDFHALILPEIVALSEQSPLFQRLHAISKEERSVAHADFTPFEHSINVLKLLNTEGLTPQQRYETRKSALLHDLGKIMIAKGDDKDDHPFLSGWIAKTYLDRSCATVEHNTHIVNLIQYHHILQALEQGVLDHAEVNAMIPTELLPMLGALSLADVQSVTGYEQFAVKNGAVFLQLLLENVEHLGEQGQVFLEKFAQGLILFAKDLVQKAGEIAKKAEGFIDELVLFIEQHLHSLTSELNALKSVRSAQ